MSNSDDSVDFPSPASSGANDRTFEFLLNAMESAAASREPFKHGYAEKRAAVFAHVTALEAEVAQKDAEIARLKAATKWTFPAEAPDDAQLCVCWFDDHDTTAKVLLKNGQFVTMADIRASQFPPARGSETP